ncbi:MAG: GNAT family N-acetyltransferase, partial [Bacteroidia bacterium]|nr:GNAT family N-acetyltransferase [Bacteroidia bacterium]
TYYDSISTWGYSGPLLANNSEISVLCHFWSVVDRWYQENQVISEFIRFNLTGNHRFYSGTVVPGMHNIKGRIIEPDMIWKNYVHKVRTNIRRARKVGLTVKICHRTISEEEFKAFYKIFKHTLDRNNAETIYYHPSDKLKTFIRNNPESCLIALTLKDNIPIAAELVLISKDTIYGFIGGTLAEYFPLRPNEILKHEVIRWAVNNKKRYYVLGGGYGYDDGIFRYKKSFFPGDIIDFQTGRKIIDQEIYSKLSGIDYSEYRIDKDFFPLYRKCRVPYKDLHLK